MASSFVISMTFFLLRHQGHPLPFAQSAIYLVAFTTICWVLAACFLPPTDDAKLVEFYQKVRPSGPGWERIRRLAGVSIEEAAATVENLPLATIGWVSGCIAVWSSLFAVGNFLYGRTAPAIVLLVMFLISGSVLIWVVNRIWSKPSLAEEKEAAAAMA